jgi:hypothetical protein
MMKNPWTQAKSQTVSSTALCSLASYSDRQPTLSAVGNDHAEYFLKTSTKLDMEMSLESSLRKQASIAI